MCGILAINAATQRNLDLTGRRPGKSFLFFITAENLPPVGNLVNHGRGLSREVVDAGRKSP